MEERGKNLQRNITDAEVSISRLPEYELGHMHYQLGYRPQLWAHVLIAVGQLTFSFSPNLVFELK